MSRTLYLDLSAGVAGDMLTAALLDLGAPLPEVEGALDALGLGRIVVRTRRVQRGAFTATLFEVDPSSPLPLLGSPQAPADGAGEEDRRTWPAIRELLEQASLPRRVARRALRVFERLAQAEAQVHGVSEESVHFHEVGAVDSIADVVGACVALEVLDVDRVVASEMPLGRGTIRTAHGLLPLPAPATAHLLTQWPVEAAPGSGEWVTPTGAALVTTLGRPGSLPRMRLVGVGYGAGTREEGPRPNLVRAFLGEEHAEGASGDLSVDTDQVLVLEAQMDDLPGEWLPPLFDALLEAGALDVHAAPVWMKKGRSGLWVTALARPERARSISEVFLRHGTTLGVRSHRAHRVLLPRRRVVVETRYGPVALKVAGSADQPLRAAPEYEDCHRLARRHGIPIRQVHDAALAAWSGES